MTSRRRINLSISQGRYRELRAEAEGRGQRLATYLIDLVNRPGPTQPSPRSGGPAPTSDRLEPGGAGGTEWRAGLWRDVCALARRYEQAFANLERQWTTRADRVETLGALVAWRSQLDSGIDVDHRSELLFQRALLEWSAIWRSTSKGTDLHSFNPDQTPPDGWETRRGAPRTW